MERTESIVVQVAPDYENTKIKEMEMFGWNLQSRQEIHEEGEAYGRPSFLDSDEYIIKTKVSHYTKLHFVRSLSLPNLDQIKRIESEYFSLPFLSPPSWKGPIIFIAAWLLVIGPVLTAIIASVAEMLGVVLYFVGIALGSLWIYSTVKKRKAARQSCEQSAHRARELVGQLEALG